jgi:hypothetical protein
MIDCRAVAVGGRRVVRVGAYQVDPGGGDPPERRVFIAGGFEDGPPFPFGPDVVDLPASALPALIEALSSLGAA